MIWEIWVFLTLLLLSLAFLILQRRQQRRYLKKRMREAISGSLKEEIEQERGEALRRKQKFEEALKRHETS